MLASLIAGLASGETALAIRRARVAAIAYVLAGMAGICGLGFLLGAFFMWLARRLGPIEAALWIGGGFIVVAVAILVIHRVVAGARARQAAERRKSDMAAVGIAAALAVLPGLLRSRAGIGALVVPALAVIGYAIYRENTRPKPDPGSTEQ
ncbi:MAG: hypothetical protein NTV73_05825 [Hyphomicrobiales bacterium]|nr:hypothetical protein [Hyphomicrobiales bacterium]